MLEEMGADKCEHLYLFGYIHFELLEQNLVCEFNPPKGEHLKWSCAYNNCNLEKGVQSCLFIAEILREVRPEYYKQLPYCLRKSISDRKIESMHSVFSKECDRKILCEEKEKFDSFIKEWDYKRKKIGIK